MATQNNTVYSIDASSGAVNWTNHLGSPVAGSQLCNSPIPTVGITSTPVIDLANSVLYTVALLQPGTYVLFALDLATGKILWRRDNISPPGEAATDVLQRGALALSHGLVYVPFGGMDCPTSQGAVVGVPANGQGPLLAYQMPVGSGGGMWAASGPMVDDAGNLYLTTSNNPNATTYDYSESVIKLSPSLTLLDSFAPGNWSQLTQQGLDLGSTGPLAVVPGVLFAIGKQGVGYLLDETKLGGIGGQSFSAQVCPPGSGPSGSPAWTSNYPGFAIYVPCQDAVVTVLVDSASSFRVFTGFPLLLPSGALAPGAVIVAGGVWTMTPGGAFFGTGNYIDLPGSPITPFPSLAAGNNQLFVPIGRSLTSYKVYEGSGGLLGGWNFELGIGPATGGLPAMHWGAGTGQSGYLLLREPDGLVIPLAADATSYFDNAAPTAAVECYQLIAISGSQLLGFSDEMCLLPNTQSATGSPQLLAMVLEDRDWPGQLWNVATLGWWALPPGGADSYLLGALPLGGNWRTLAEPANSTGITDDTGGTPTCYVLVTQNSQQLPVGNTNLVCGIPGSSFLPNSGPGPTPTTTSTSAPTISQVKTKARDAANKLLQAKLREQLQQNLLKLKSRAAPPTATVPSQIRTATATATATAIATVATTATPTSTRTIASGSQTATPTHAATVRPGLGR